MLVIYQGSDEVLVCTPDRESSMFKDYFVDGGRSVDDYERSESEDVVEITTRLRVDVVER